MAQFVRIFHDLQNIFGAARLNIEVAANPKHASGVALDAARDALRDLDRLERSLADLRVGLETAPDPSGSGAASIGDEDTSAA